MRFPLALRLVAALLVLPLTGCAVPVASEPVGASSAKPRVARAVTSAAAGVLDPTSGTALIATAQEPTTRVHARADGAVRERVASPTPEGAPRTFLVVEDRGDWLRVLLPGRRPGLSGWVRASDVDLTMTDWRLDVSLSRRELTVWRGAMQVATHPVGVGKVATPTPTGLYYVTDLLRPLTADSPYGPYAFGLSAYSPVLTRFAGGPGQIGLHGTNDPSSIGKVVSHGCLRIDNDVVTGLAAQLPLGTPVSITA